MRGRVCLHCEVGRTVRVKASQPIKPSLALSCLTYFLATFSGVSLALLLAAEEGEEAAEFAEEDAIVCLSRGSKARTSQGPVSVEWPGK